MAGFSLSHDEALVMLTKAEGVLRELQSLRSSADHLARTAPAADDPASKGYNTQLTWNGALTHGVRHMGLEQDYVASLVDQLRKALHLVPLSDQQRAQDLNGSAGGEGGFL